LRRVPVCAKTGAMTPDPVLPDILRKNLRIVFCGTAAGSVSAARGQYYGHPHNKFWRTLHEIGLTPRRLEPAEYPSVLDYGLGLTDIAKHVAGMDSQLPAGSLGSDATARLRAKIMRFEPRILAFTSRTGGGKFLKTAAGVGLQPETLGSVRIWILPSPSPAAHWNWDIAPWHALAEAARAA